MKTLLLGLGITLFFQTQFAFSQDAELRMVGNPASTITSNGVSVPLHKEAKIFLPGETEGTTVYLSGAGILVKPVGFIKVNVYILTSYIDNINGVSPTEPLKSIEDAKVKAVQMTLLRDVSPSQIKNEFELALNANGIDLNSEGIADMLAHINFNMSVRDSVTFIGHAPTSLETVHTYTSTGVRFASVDKNLSNDFWKLWFGNPANSGYANLKQKLVGKF